MRSGKQQTWLTD